MTATDTADAAKATATASSGVSPTDDGDIAAMVSAEQLRMLLAHTAFGTLAATAFAMFVGFHFLRGALGVAAAPWVIAWMLAKLIVALARVVHAHFYRRLGFPADNLWRRGTTILLAVDGVVWGAGGAALMGGSSELATFIVAALGCTASVATFGLAVRFSATCAYVIPMLAPLSIAYMARGDQVGLLGGVGITIFLALLLATSRRWEKRMEEVFRLRIVTERVSQERADALALAQLHSSAKDRFLAVVSHELRTPLHGILGLTRLARNEVPRANASLQHRLQMIEEAGTHLQRMVNDLLDISSFKAGRLELKIAPVDLSREIALLCETYLARANESGLRFTTPMDATIGGYVSGDAVRIAQVLHNLLGNAFKFTPLGGSVEFSIARDPDSDVLRFSVHDTGPGIPADELERVFEVFVQGSYRKESRREGAGLGLAIARQLARAMGGDVTCSSKVGVGSTFVFTVPLPITSAPAVVTLSEVRRKTQVRVGAGRVVAIADDDEVSLLICAAQLRRLGYEIQEHTSGRSLLAKALRTSDRPDFILMDWDMPNMDGKAATMAIRDYERAHELPRVPIICLSGNAAVDFASDAMSAGMDWFLSKPCTPEAIASVVEDFLAGNMIHEVAHCGAARGGSSWPVDSSLMPLQ